MRSLITGCLLFAFYRISAQCPYDAHLKTPGGTCIGDQINIHSSHALSKIIWYKDGVVVSTVTGAQKYGEVVTVAGDHGDGSGAAQFGEDPAGIFVDDEGNIYVADVTNNRIQKWAPGASQGITVAGGNGQ